MTRALTEFDSTVLSANVLTGLNETLIWADERIATRDYEGEIRGKGSTVRVNTLAPVSITDYEPNTDMTAPETLSASSVDIVVDQFKAFHFQVDNVDEAFGAAGVAEKSAEGAGRSLAEVEDAHLATTLQAGITGAARVVGSNANPVEVYDAQTAYKALQALGVKLTRQKVARNGRWVVLPPELEAALLSEGNFVRNDQEPLYSGELGQAAGFHLLSTSVGFSDSANAVHQVVAGVPGGFAAVGAINETEIYKPELRFATAIKGLYVFGAKIVAPDRLAKGFIKITDAPSGGEPGGGDD